MSAAGWVLAAGSIELANEAVFAPLEGQGTPWKDVNWRIVPATAVLAITLTGFEKVAPQFGNILGGLVLLGVLIIPFGNAPTPLENISNVIVGKKGGN
jgi:hypothetical protein